MTTLLALDLGTRTGWAMRTPDGIESGSWELRGEQRERILAILVDDLRKRRDITRVVYEQPVVYPGRYSGILVLARLEGALQLYCQTQGVSCESLTPTAVKKVATGKGNAKKAAVREAMARAYPDQAITSMDQSDALAVLMAATQPSTGTGR